MSKYICPRCFEKQDIKDIKYICTNSSKSASCSRAQERKAFKPNVRQKHPVCDECGKALVCKVCPKCNFELPFGIEKTKNYPIAIIGAKECGKSNYVAVLINQMKNSIGRAFDCSVMACGDSTLNRYQTEFFDPIYKHKTCAGATDSGDVEPLIYTLLFRKKRRFTSRKFNQAASLTFFDTAGENLTSISSMQSHNGYLCHSSGIILLLDPLQLPFVRDKLDDKIRLPEENTDVNTILARTVEIIRSGTGLTDLSQKIDVPIAISFTKIDAVDSLLDPMSCLKNDSTHIKNGFFDERDFNDSNEEMQSLVEKWLGIELYQNVSMQFKDFAFFGLSALGSNPDAQNKIPRFRPFRVADPFLWLLAKKKLIKTK